MRPYHVAIVGSGPSGFFAAASLLKAADSAEDFDTRVDMLEMLPTPWGLVRSGVAPDHPKIKSISKQFEKIAEDPRFRFFGNVVVGEHIEAAELAERYDAVIYAIGTQSDRSLNIPGEELAGSVAAVDFVGWYNAHPHFEETTPDLSGARAVVVGNGNVALDVARILITDPDVLAETDIADHALESLRPCGVEEVVIIGRRGPLQSAFTTLELRELVDLEGVDVIVDPAQLEGISDEDAAAVGKIAKQNIKVLRDYASREPRPGHRRMVFRFLTSPIEIKGEDRSKASCSAATSWSPTRMDGCRPRTPATARSCRFSWSCDRWGIAVCPLQVCRSTTRARLSRTPTAGWRAVATSTSSAGSSADRAG